MTGLMIWASDFHNPQLSRRAVRKSFGCVRSITGGPIGFLLRLVSRYLARTLPRLLTLSSRILVNRRSKRPFSGMMIASWVFGGACCPLKTSAADAPFLLTTHCGSTKSATKRIWTSPLLYLAISSTVVARARAAKVRRGFDTLFKVV